MTDNDEAYGQAASGGELQEEELKQEPNSEAGFETRGEGAASGSSQPQGALGPSPEPQPQLDYQQIIASVLRATEDGMFPLLAYGLDKTARPNRILFVTSTINDMVLAKDLLIRFLPAEYEFYGYVPWSKLELFAREHSRIVRAKEDEIPSLDATRDAPALSRIIRDHTAWHWLKKSFAVVDICGFSRLSPEEQLAHRTSLSVALGQAANRVQKLHLSGYLPGAAQFCSSSTGDGFYLWHRFPGGANDVDVFMLLLFLMTASEALRATGKSSLRLRGAYAIGEAYTFPARTLGTVLYRTSLVQEAIGPVLNDLSRLMDKSVPGQILVGDFKQTGRTPEEALTPTALIEQAARELLPSELQPSDRVKPQHLSLEFDPPHPLRISDKHRFVHYCYNLVGSAPNRFAGEPVRLQRVGVAPENAQAFDELMFRES